jgi:tetratricopeptide (TPR) repeat protein
VKRFPFAAAMVLLAWPLHAQLATRPNPVPAQAEEATGDEQEPPEEDESLKPRSDYVFNPLQAEKEMKIGGFYFKRGSFPAAALRFEEATKWNPGFAEAWRRLGEAREKLNDGPAAATAYAKFLELAPEDKQAPAIKKKLAAMSKRARKG